MGLRAGQSGDSVRTFDLDDFAGGWDLREGLFSSDQNRFTDLLNCYITVGKKVRRRPPLIKSPGAYDTANAQGMIYAGGRWYCIAKKGAAPTNTISAITLNTLLFDNPDYCTTWTLIETKIFNGFVCAIIRHDFPGTTMTARYMLHVFDGKANKPTYVEDPACPTNWGPAFPQTLYAQNATVGAPDMVYVPTMRVGGGHLWIARPDGNPACSKVNNPRFWNQRAVSDIVSGGEWWYFIIPNNGASLRRFIVSEDPASLTMGLNRIALPVNFFARYSCYVLEYLDADGYWRKFCEDAIGVDPVADKHYSCTTVASRFTGNEIQINVYWTGATDVVIRFRAIAGLPPASVISGGAWDATSQNRTEGLMSFEGRTLALAVVGPLAAGVPAFYFWDTATNDFSDIPAGATLSQRYDQQSLNGLQRYYGFISDSLWDNGSSGLGATTAFVYAGTTGQENDWYLAKLSDYTVNQAGAGEASFLNTQNNNPNGGYLKAMGNLLKHMTFSYESNTQLWAVSADPSASAYQTSLDIGVGTDQSRPVAVGFYDLVMLPTPTGLRGFNMQQGLLVNSLQDNNVGEPITAARLADLTEACWWPFLGVYITAGVLDGAVQWYVLSESRESEVSAWSRWISRNITTIDAMMPLQNRLYIKCGDGIYYFDASRTITENGAVGTGGFRDSNDLAGAGNAYVSSGRWHFNDMKRPKDEKEFFNFDTVQIGIANWTFGFYPKDLTAITPPVPVVGTSVGDFPYSLGFSGAGIAPAFSSTDESGFQIEGLSIAFSYLGRG